MCRSKLLLYFHVVITLGLSFLVGTSLVAQLVKKKKKKSACNVGDLGSIPGLGRSPGSGKGLPLQCSGLENSMECVVHGCKKSDMTK